MLFPNSVAISQNDYAAGIIAVDASLATA